MTPRGAVRASGGRDPQTEWEGEEKCSDHTGQKKSINPTETLSTTTEGLNSVSLSSVQALLSGTFKC